MGIYYNPPGDIGRSGRRLQRDAYEALRAQLRAGEVLIGMYDHGEYQAAPLIDSQAEFDRQEGNKAGLGSFYAVPEAQAKQGLQR